MNPYGRGSWRAKDKLIRNECKHCTNKANKQSPYCDEHWEKAKATDRKAKLCKGRKNSVYRILEHLSQMSAIGYITGLDEDLVKAHILSGKLKIGTIKITV
jgi:sulfatase maturation enzyme AslB (radical SAM superfamily)